MNLRDLKSFLLLSDCGHFGQAARTLHVSPSTLSRQIQRLETQLGCTLFLRTHRALTLTEAGRQLQTFARQTLTHYQQLRHALNPPQLQGELHLFCSVTAAYSHLPAILDRFQARYPQVEIKLTTGDAAEAVEKVLLCEADLAIAGRPQQLPDSLAFTPLDELALLLIGPDRAGALQQHLSQPEPDWRQIPFILPEQGPVRQRALQWFEKQKLSHPVIYATVAGHEAMISMVALGCGVAIIPEVVLANSPESVRQRVRIISQAGPITPPLELGVCVRQKRLDEALLRAFWTLL